VIAAPASLERREHASRLRAEQLYGRLLATAVNHVFAGGPPPPTVCTRSEDGRTEPLSIERWVEPVDAGDTEILAGVTGPVLDIGCGPGRHVAALRGSGVAALGVDLSPIAVRVTRQRGGDAVPGSIFADVPGAGRWQTALLLDGNIGIGGDPALLLRRVRELLAPGGSAVVELDPPGVRTERIRVRLEAPGVISEWFPWARAGVDGIGVPAIAAGLDPAPPRRAGNRWYVHLRRR
jgi:SAM-dependent methyltransferase